MKSYAVVMPDADAGSTSRGIIEAAFGCAGERCIGCRLISAADRLTVYERIFNRG